MSSRDVLIQRVGQKLAERDLSERAASLKAKLSAGFLKGLRRGTSSPTLENVERIADVLGCSVSWLVGETDVDERAAPSQTRPELLRVVGEVRATSFRRALELPEDEQKVVWLPSDPRFPGVRRFLLRVDGPSVNLIAPDGGYVICAPFPELGRLGREPMHGDLVVVRRRHGDMYEATVKAYAVRADGIWLEPRSTLASIEAIHLKGPAGQDLALPDDDEVAIHALVTGVHFDL